MICAEEAFICKDFAETNNMLKIVTDFSASVKKVGARTLNFLTLGGGGFKPSCCVVIS